MKRYSLIFLAMLLLLLCTGCSINKQELTKEENNLIAEYVAGVLLKHDMHYSEKLMYEIPEEELDVLPEETQKPPESTDAPTAEEEIPSYLHTADMYKSYGITVRYKESKEYQSYPKLSGDTGSALGFSLEAAENRKLLIVFFSLENKGKTDKNFCLINEGFSYRLKDAQGKESKPLLTAIINDLQYLDMKIGPGKKKEAIVAFMIPEDAKKTDYTMYISKGKQTAEIPIK